jgi:hypothetical protein
MTAEQAAAAVDLVGKLEVMNAFGSIASTTEGNKT